MSSSLNERKRIVGCKMMMIDEEKILGIAINRIHEYFHVICTEGAFLTPGSALYNI